MPSLDAARGGVAAYGFELAARLPGGLAEASFLALHGQPEKLAAPSVLIAPRAEALAAELARSGGTRVLLHYSGYGYAPNGFPHWLLAGLRQWKQSAPAHRLDIFFHELMTDEPWWTRTFWTQPSQKRVVDGLVATADRLATNCTLFADRLAQRHGARPEKVVCAPVPPTLLDDAADTPAVRDFTRTGLVALVFGLRPTRLRALRAHRDLLRTLASSGRLSRVILAGDDAQSDEADGILPTGVPREAHRALDAAQLAALAARADFGLVWNWPSILTKSTVFANLCALGLPAVVAQGPDEIHGTPEARGYLISGGKSPAAHDELVALTDARRREAVQTRAVELARTTLSWSHTATLLTAHFEL